MPIGTLTGELTKQEKEEQTGMMLVTLAGKVAGWLRRKDKDARAPLWAMITNNIAGRYDTGKGTFDQKRARMIKDFVKRHPELKSKLDARKPAK
jgi:hypothetical protein